jgi:hypothetical protein
MSDTFDVCSIGRCAGSANFLVLRPWGFAALHPRLYAVGRFANYANSLVLRILGLRCAAPQALRRRPLRGLCKCSCADDPGVPLRCTPGFMPSGRCAGYENFLVLLVLGFRCATPQKL